MVIWGKMVTVMASIYRSVVVLFTRYCPSPPFEYPGEFKEEAEEKNRLFCERFGRHPDLIYEYSSDRVDEEEAMVDEGIWPSERLDPRGRRSYKRWLEELEPDDERMSYAFKVGEMIYAEAVRVDMEKTTVRCLGDGDGGCLAFNVPTDCVELFLRPAGDWLFHEMSTMVRTCLKHGGLRAPFSLGLERRDADNTASQRRADVP